jgi:hypothetical protein
VVDPVLGTVVIDPVVGTVPVVLTDPTDTCVVLPEGAAAGVPVTVP